MPAPFRTEPNCSTSIHPDGRVSVRIQYLSAILRLPYCAARISKKIRLILTLPYLTLERDSHTLYPLTVSVPSDVTLSQALSLHHLTRHVKLVACSNPGLVPFELQSTGPSPVSRAVMDKS